MSQLDRKDLYSLEQYAEARENFRTDVLAHKANRNLKIGDNATVYFEDQRTIQYQIQEMLRIEKIFEAAEIQEELDTYNPLIPDGDNLKATFMIEYTDVAERQKMLNLLVGIEDKLWLQVEGMDKVWAIADEDLERSDADKTSAVHFVRFQFTNEMIMALKNGAKLSAGIDHPEYSEIVSPIPENIQYSLLQDFA